MMKIRAIFEFMLIMGVLLAPIGTLIRWVVSLDKKTVKQAQVAGWGGGPYLIWPVFFYGGWTFLILGGVGTLMLWAITGSLR
jgi:hypothetical protein